MLDISWTELLIIGIIALIVIGPKELPGALRAAGHWMGKIRRMAGEFQDQFRDAMREAEVADLKQQFDDMTQSASSLTNFDPLESVREDVENVFSPDSGPDLHAAKSETDSIIQPTSGDDFIGPRRPQPALPAQKIDVAEPPQPAKVGGSV